MSKLEAFLSTFSTTEDPFTHTRITGGKYNIPVEKHAKLYKYLSDHLFEKEDWFDLLEKHPEDHSKICVDLDFQYKAKTSREITETLIQTIVEEINKAILKYSVSIDKNLLNAYVFIRPKMYKSSNKSGEIWKDGIHIMYPKIEFDYPTQFAIFDEYTKNFLDLDIELKADKNKLFDRSVIKSNNWFMYGCTKKDTEAYQIFKIYNNQMEEISCNMDNIDLIKLLSLQSNRGKLIESNYKPEDKPKKFISNRVSECSPEYEEKIEKLLDILPDKYVDEHELWRNIGSALYNTHPDLFDVFDKWSKKSVKYGKTQEYWKAFSKRDDSKVKNSLGTVIYLAKTADKAKFDEWDKNYNNSHHSNKEKLINSAIYDNCHYDYAKLLYHESENEFAYSDSKWYQFKNHRWNQIKDLDNIVLKKKLETILDDFEDKRKIALSKNESLSKNDEDDNLTEIEKKIGKNEKDERKSDLKLITSSIKALKTSGFKTSVISECKMFFYNDNFTELLDMNKNLIGFNNGVFDLEKMEFREGHPTDYISYSTGYDFTDVIDADIQNIIFTKLKEIQPNQKVLDFILTVFASTLQGENINELFVCLEGSGGNGKSFISDLHSYSIGEYSDVLNNNYLVNTFNAPEHHNTMLYNIYRKRCVFVNEPPKNKEFNLNFIKELTGGDKLQLRPAHSMITYTVQPQFKLICLFNKIPKIEDTTDGGFLRRFCGVKFPNKFVDNPTKAGEYKKDPTLKFKVKSDIKWHQQWILILLQYFKKYQDNNYTFEIPSEVKDNSKKLINNQDIVQDFIENNIEFVEDKSEYMSINEIYPIYSTYHTGTNKDTKPLNKKEFIERIKDILEKDIDSGKIDYKETFKRKKDVFIGIKVKNLLVNSDSDDS